MILANGNAKFNQDASQQEVNNINMTQITEVKSLGKFGVYNLY